MKETINGRPYKIPTSALNYHVVVNCIRAKKWQNPAKHSGWIFLFIAENAYFQESDSLQLLWWMSLVFFADMKWKDYTE